MGISNIRSSARKQAGDTIVEVLVCIAILGAVLGGAYATANANSRINQASQDRLAGIKVAESQMELLKAYASSKPQETFAITQPFCLYYDEASVPPAVKAQIPAPTDGGAHCRVNSGGGSTTTDPSYYVSIVPEAGGTETYNSILIGQRYKITVSWDSIKGTGRDNVSYSYGVYKK